MKNSNKHTKITVIFLYAQIKITIKKEKSLCAEHLKNTTIKKFMICSLMS